MHCFTIMLERLKVVSIQELQQEFEVLTNIIFERGDEYLRLVLFAIVYSSMGTLGCEIINTQKWCSFCYWVVG